MMGRNNCTCQGERSKAQLMETIGQSAFAAYDTLLYMDTHPQDQEAMAYYHKQAGIRREAMEEYARRFGPLTMVNITKTDARIAKIIATQYGGPDCNTLQIAGKPHFIRVSGVFFMK